MKTLKNIIIAAGLLVFLVTNTKAQNAVSLYYLENVPQSSYVNPAMAPRANLFIGLPVVNSVYFGLRTDLFGPNFIQESGNVGHILVNQEFDYDKLYNGIGKAANFGINSFFTPVFFGFSGKKGYFTFGITDRISAGFNLPKSFFEIAEKGFPEHNFDFSPLGFNASYYREFMAGYSYQFTSKLRVGAHIKLLQGISSVKTDITKFDFNTSSTKWSIDTDAAIYASAPLYVTKNENGVPTEVGIDSTLETPDYLDFLLFNFKNPGFAFDIGAVYDLNEAWSFSAALNDIGFIRWGSNLNSFSTKGSFSFEGVSAGVNDIQNMDSIFDEVVDSLKNVINIKDGQEGFSTGLGPQLYLGAEYKVNHYLSLGALSRTVFKKYDFQQEFTASANLNLYHFLTTTINYTLAISGANSMGLGLGFRGGPMQFYFIADYLPTSYRFYNIETEDENGKKSQDRYPGPISFENFNLMFGLNIIVGANGFKDSPMIDAYSEF